MNTGPYDEGRFLICKNEDCHEPIRILSQTLLRGVPHPGLKGTAIPHTFLACRVCGHVYGYTPQDVHFSGAGHILGPGPETVPRLGRVEFSCGGQNCAARVLILVPTSADNLELLRAGVDQLKIGELRCRADHAQGLIPKDCAVAFDRSDWVFP
jgi:hypothetical protein